MDKISLALMILLVAKSLTIGSSFSFLLWFKYGDEYYKWYVEKESKQFPKE